MNSYVILDSKYYTATHSTWKQSQERPMMMRTLLSGTRDIVYGVDFPNQWEGKLRVPVSASGSYGTISDFRTTYAKKQSLSFTDHLGNAYSVVILGNITEESLTPMWDASANVYLIPVQIVEV